MYDLRCEAEDLTELPLRDDAARPGARTGRGRRARARRVPGRYCSTACQRIDWRDRGHRKACKKIRNERAAEAARAEAPTPASPPKEIFYGPAPRSHADEVRARIAAEHEAARVRREANPEPEPYSARFGARCPICMEEWDVNEATALLPCCCRRVCDSCDTKIFNAKMPCPLCRLPFPSDEAEYLARLRRHAKSEVPEAVGLLGNCYRQGTHHVTKSEKKAVKLYKRAVELGNLDAMSNLAFMYEFGHGVKVDKAKTLQLLRMAADRGHAMAQKNLGGFFFQEGKVEEAFRLFMLSAEQGFTDAEYLVGVMLLKSWPGAPADREEEGRRWLVRAAAKGQEEAKRELAHLEQLA